MGMTDEKMLAVIALYEDELPDIANDAEDENDHDDAARIRHVIGMLPEMRGFIAEGRREKAMRWLGFAQGVLWAADVFSIDEMKAHNRPDAYDEMGPYNDPSCPPR